MDKNGNQAEQTGCDGTQKQFDRWEPKEIILIAFHTARNW